MKTLIGLILVLVLATVGACSDDSEPATEAGIMDAQSETISETGSDQTPADAGVDVKVDDAAADGAVVEAGQG